MRGSAAPRTGLAAAAGLATVAASVALLALASPPVSAGPAGLPPDLVTLAITESELKVRVEEGRTVLRFTNEIGNHGNGPLEIFPSAVSAGCDGDADPANDRDASQRLFADSNASGGYERAADSVATERPIGCMRYHPAHDHWHVLEVAAYELRREPGGKTMLRSRKVGFCLTDARLAFAGPLTPAGPTYPINPQGINGCQSVSTQGISPGWADAYLLALPGQTFDVTGLPRGHYCLTARADPVDQLAELDEANNVRRVRLALRPELPRVRKLDGPCRV
jgi:Lysyl oxidase